MPLHLYIIYGDFWTIVAELNTFDRDCMAHKAENIYHQALYRKC